MYIWSEEDEKMIARCIDIFEKIPKSSYAYAYIKDCLSWLKSLKDRVQPTANKEWSEEHEKLIIEENNLIKKLKNEVTKTKENLEKYLSKSNEIIENYEKIKKGIKFLEKEQK